MNKSDLAATIAKEFDLAKRPSVTETVTTGEVVAKLGSYLLPHRTFSGQ